MRLCDNEIPHARFWMLDFTDRFDNSSRVVKS
jgi:hypothetical protein